MKYIYVVTAISSPRIFGTFTSLGTLQTWMVNSKYTPKNLYVWRFVDGSPDVKADKIQWSSGKVIE